MKLWIGHNPKWRNCQIKNMGFAGSLLPANSVSGGDWFEESSKNWISILAAYIYSGMYFLAISVFERVFIIFF